ncbi:MAG: hypothetical protein J0L82_18440 [Deltaproteobacteria bacterium]|nr:hypothetical protein [Deltaproteobacteria bacterium]
MKLPKIAAALLLSVMSHTALAQEKAAAPEIDTSVYDKETIKQAMVVLLKSRAVTIEPKKGARINRRLIEELRRDGIIEPAATKAGVVCTDSTGK